MSGLEGHVAMLHDLGDIADDINQIRLKIAGVGGGVADALDAWDAGEELEKLAEGNLSFGEVFAVAVDGLSEESDFLGSEFGESSRFGDDVFGWS